MSVLDDFLNEVLPSVKGCPRQLAVNAVLDSMRELCEKADVWKQTLTAINVVSETASYAMNPGYGLQVVAPTSVYHDDVPLYPITENQIDYANPYWRVAESDTPRYYLVLNVNTITLHPTPDTSLTGGLVIHATIKPTVSMAGDYLVDSTGAKIVSGTDYLSVEDFATLLPGILLDHKETVAYGAKARLMIVPQKAWSNPQLAMAMNTLFRAGVSRAGAKANLGNTRTIIRARIPFF